MVVAAVVGSSRAQNPQVTLPGLGTMEGYMDASYINERPFYHFRGVPFAQPPINNLRFKVKNAANNILIYEYCCSKSLKFKFSLNL